MSDRERSRSSMSRLRLLLALCLLVPWCASAQAPGTTPRVGLLDTGTLAGRAPLWEQFRQGMRELGYVQGKTVILEARAADGKPDRLPGLVAELVRLKVDVIVTAGVAAAQAAREGTATIPIVTASGSPLEGGVVPSLARPGGNVTGVTTLSVELSAKRFELARDIVPKASRVAILGDVRNSPTTSVQIKETETAARALGVHLHTVTVEGTAELDGAFSTIARERPAILLIVTSPMFFGERRRLAELAVKHRLPTVSGSREYAEAGGLVAYGASRTESFRRAAVYVDISKYVGLVNSFLTV